MQKKKFQQHHVWEYTTETHNVPEELTHASKTPLSQFRHLFN
jgi:hypothetical protein